MPFLLQWWQQNHFNQRNQNVGVEIVNSILTTPISADVLLQNTCQVKTIKNTNRWCEICRNTSHDTKFCRKLSQVRQVTLDHNQNSKNGSELNHFTFSLDDSAGEKSVLNNFLVDSEWCYCSCSVASSNVVWQLII